VKSESCTHLWKFGKFFFSLPCLALHITIIAEESEDRKGSHSSISQGPNMDYYHRTPHTQSYFNSFDKFELVSLSLRKKNNSFPSPTPSPSQDGGGQASLVDIDFGGKGFSELEIPLVKFLRISSLCKLFFIIMIFFQFYEPETRARKFRNRLRQPDEPIPKIMKIFQ
jgi:hypothetical protein